MFRRILAATDFSVAARRAVIRAALMAKRTGAELHVLHALPERRLLDRLFRSSGVDFAAVTAGAERALQAELDTIRKHAGILAQAMTFEGSAQQVIATAASTIEADLIVIGAHGEREAAHGARMLGGTALKCFARATRPLLLVRREVEANYYKILAAADGSPDSDRVIAAALQAGGKRAICQVLHVFEAPFAQRLRGHEVKEATIAAYASEELEKSQSTLAEILTRLDGAEGITPIVVRGGAAEVLVREIRERGPDLVVVGKRRVLPDPRSNDTHYFGSVSLRVAYEAATDVLVIP